ncbi:MAG: DUF5618 family protein [Bacteroidales bacterium]|jgi:hypothetical protein
MSIKEQHEVRDKYYNEAVRYMDNAKETLKKAGKENKFYKDDKYVKTACGIAYNGILKALDGYFILKNMSSPKGKKSIQYYQSNITKLDKKLLNYINNAYEILHISGYYEGVTSVKVIQTGFEYAYEIINKIKP